MNNVNFFSKDYWFKHISRDKALIRELSDELDKSRIDSRERETRIINDLTKARSHAKELKDQLYQRDDQLRDKISENNNLQAQVEVYSKEVSSSWRNYSA